MALSLRAGRRQSAGGGDAGPPEAPRRAPSVRAGEASRSRPGLSLGEFTAGVGRLLALEETIHSFQPLLCQTETPTQYPRVLCGPRYFLKRGAFSYGNIRCVFKLNEPRLMGSPPLPVLVSPCSSTAGTTWSRATSHRARPAPGCRGAGAPTGSCKSRIRSPVPVAQ